MIPGPEDDSLVARTLRHRLDVAEAALTAVLNDAGCAADGGARRDMLASLARRLARACVSILVRETRRDPSAAGHGGVDGAAAFAALPALEPILGRLAADWLAAIRELTVRFVADQHDLSAGLLGGAAPGAITGYAGDAGDLHGGGRCVALLALEGGRLVYKPKDLRVADALGALLGFLTEHGLPLSLRTPARLVRGPFAWEELVRSAPCRDQAQVAAFYTRIGMYLRLMQLLEARDLWLDNLIAAGEHPVFIDVETLLQPRWRGPHAPPAARAARDLLRDSVATIGILSMPTLIATGRRAEDLGAVTPPRPMLTPFPYDATVDELLGRRTGHRDGFRLWSPDAHAPTLDGAPCRAADHVDQILEGHRIMQRCLGANRDRLLEPGGALARFRGLPVRVILRNTWAYQRIVDASLNPELLRQVGVREAALASARWESGGRETGALAAVFAAERAALARLDVPYFVAESDGASILDPSDATVLAADVLEPSAFARAQRRVADVESFATRREEAILVTTLGIAAGSPRSLPSPRRSHPPVDWLGHAVELGDLVLDQSIHHDGDRAWIGLAYDPLHDLSQLQVLGPDLLSGTGGIALALAELFAATGELRFREAALQLLPAIERMLEADAGPGPIGLIGTGGYLYASARCRAALGIAPPTGRNGIVERTLAQSRGAAAWDVITGRVGLGLAALAAGSPLREVEALARQAEGIAARGFPDSAYPPGAAVDGALPGTTEGWRLLRHRLAAAGALTPVAGPAPRRNDVVEETADLIVVVAVLEKSSQEHQAAVEAARAWLQARRGRVLDRASLALEAWRATADGWFRDEAEALGAGLLGDRQERGRWLSDVSCAQEHLLSVFWGLPAIIELFSSLGCTTRNVPSSRLVGPAFAKIE